MNMTLQREIHILDLCTRQTEAGCQILRGDLGMTKGPTPGDLGKQVSSIALPLEAGLRPLSLVARQCEESWRGYSAVLGCLEALSPLPFYAAPLAKTILNLCIAGPPTPPALPDGEQTNMACALQGCQEFLFLTLCILEQSFMNPQQMFLSPFIFLFQRNCNRLRFN